MSNLPKVIVKDKEDIRTNHINWDEYFMSIAILSSLRSKDTSTKVGAAIVSDEHKVLSLGYNGMPIGIDYSKIPWAREGVSELDTKYPYVCHAELNAILNTERRLKGSTLYVTLFPCNECAKAVIQAGITEVVYLDIKENKQETVAAKKMLDLAGVRIRQYKAENREVVLYL